MKGTFEKGFYWPNTFSTHMPVRFYYRLHRSLTPENDCEQPWKSSQLAEGKTDKLGIHIYNHNL